MNNRNGQQRKPIPSHLMKNVSDRRKNVRKPSVAGYSSLARSPSRRHTNLRKGDSIKVCTARIEQLRLLNEELSDGLAECNKKIHEMLVRLRESQSRTRKDCERVKACELRWLSYQKGSLSFNECVELNAADRAKECVKRQYASFELLVNDYLLNAADQDISSGELDQKSSGKLSSHVLSEQVRSYSDDCQRELLRFDIEKLPRIFTNEQCEEKSSQNIKRLERTTHVSECIPACKIREHPIANSVVKSKTDMRPYFWKPFIEKRQRQSKSKGVNSDILFKSLGSSNVIKNNTAFPLNGDAQTISKELTQNTPACNMPLENTVDIQHSDGNDMKFNSIISGIADQTYTIDVSDVPVDLAGNINTDVEDCEFVTRNESSGLHTSVSAQKKIKSRKNGQSCRDDQSSQGRM